MSLVEFEIYNINRVTDPRVTVVRSASERWPDLINDHESRSLILGREATQDLLRATTLDPESQREEIAMLISGLADEEPPIVGGRLFNFLDGMRSAIELAQRESKQGEIHV